MTPLFVPLGQLPEYDPGGCSDARPHMAMIQRNGAGPGSLTEDGLRYWVLDGMGVCEHVPELWGWAESYGTALASAAVGRPLRLSPATEAAVNVNCLEGSGEKYELHTDSVSYTMLAWGSGPHEGGELWCSMEGAEIFVQPQIGGGVLIEGSKIPHAVLPLRERGPRYSVPVAFEAIGEEFERDAALSGHLYARP